MPHIPPTIELQEHAQLLYRRKEYTKALELLNLAITHEPSLSPLLLDNRAAVHEKLEDHSSALKDARRCIRIFEKDATGYLRAGKVLQKMSKPDVALSIYKHGMGKKVKNVEVLQRLHSKLLLSMAPAKAADPFAQLPIEIVEIILSYLNFRQIVYCTRVSKQWGNFINSLPGLWMNLDFSEAKRSVKSSFLTHCINTSRHKVTSATLKMVRNSDQVIETLSKRCPEFKALYVIDGGLQGESLVNNLKSARSLTRLKLGTSAVISGYSVSELLRNCEKLTDLECLAVHVPTAAVPWKGDYSRLRRLKLVKATQSKLVPMYQLNLNSLLTLAPNLTSLVLNNWNPGSLQLPLGTLAQKLVELDITSDAPSPPLLFPFVNLPQSLRILRLDPGRPIVRSELLSPDSFFLPNLEELVCSGANMASILLSDPDLIRAWPDPSVNRFLKFKNLSQLHTLHIKCNGGGGRVSSILALPRLERLRSLRVTDDDKVDDEVARYIATTMKSLQDVDLSSTMITGAGVRALVDGLKPTLRKLKFVNVWHCSADAPEWAREQGIRVEYSQNSEVKPKGRKVRYE